MGRNVAMNAEGCLSVSDGHVENMQVSGNCTYTGDGSGGCMHGYGTLLSAEDSYTGNFLWNLRHGRGVFQSTIDAHPTGISKYDGEWHMDKPHGNGTIEWCTGDSYTGSFHEGKPHGTSGRYTFSDGRVYVGTHREGVRQGFGRLTQRNGEYYEGNFVDGYMTGQGTGWYAGGKRVYVGLWTKGRKTHGRMTFEGSCRMYNGDWLREKPDGKGEMIFENGDHYVGDFVAGKMHGTGCMTYHSRDGESYRGTFVKNQPHGKGILTMPDNDQVVEVYFRHGRQLAKEDICSIEQVMRELEMSTPSIPVSEAQSESHDWGSTCSPASCGNSTQPHVSRNLSAEDVSADCGGHGLVDNARDSITNENYDNNNATSNGSNGASLPQTLMNGASVSAKVTPALFSSLLPGSKEQASESASLTRGAELMIPILPSVNRRSTLEDVRGSSTCLSKGEVAAMLEASTSAVAGGVTDGCKGWMEKFSIGRSRIGRSNWRRRYFVLTSFNTVAGLSYYKDELCRNPVAFIRLDTNDTRIVTRPSLRTHKEAKKPGLDLCVIYVENGKEYKLLLRADTEGEHDNWVLAFRKPFDIVDYPSDFPLLTST